MLKLKNGSMATADAVATITAALEEMLKSKDAQYVLLTLTDLCKEKREYGRCQAHEDLLKKFNLINENCTVSDDVRNIVNSKYHFGSGDDFIIHDSPVAE